MKLYKGAHCVGRGGFHFIFKTRNHKPLFRGSLAEKIRDALLPLKEKHGITDFIIRIFPHHIHLFPAPLRKTSPLAFGQEVLEILDEVVYNHYGMRDVFERDFYSATAGDISPEIVDRMLKVYGEPVAGGDVYNGEYSSWPKKQKLNTNR